MSITFNESNKTFLLTANNTSYAMTIISGGFLVNYHYGKKIESFNINNAPCLAGPNMVTVSGEEFLGREFSEDILTKEYTAFGNGDYRTPAIEVRFANGTGNLDLRYLSHEIVKGKPTILGLPQTYIEAENEAETLLITLKDELYDVKVILSYSVYEKRDVIVRSAKIINNSGEKIIVEKAMSMCLDFAASEFNVMNLHGRWIREREIQISPVTHGIFTTGSTRGSSGHEYNPFIALLSKDATEDFGDAYGFGLIYSGNFIAEVDYNENANTRIVMGINPMEFTWNLEDGEHFQTPEVVMVYSSNGIGEMSRTFHSLIRERICRGKYRDAVRPIVINNWEATVFNFNEDKLVSIAKDASEIGIEMLVMDDGWFGKRDSDNCSLGDWFVDKKKLPNGIEGLGKKINDLGMKLGIWFEPEMISPDSDLYRAHPDWCLHIPGRKRLESRQQLTIDMSRKDVQDNIIEQIKKILDTGYIDYVKWDYNRYMANVGSALLSSEKQHETYHRFTLGLYRVLEELTTSYPNVLFESCSGGGARFDLGMLYYMPQTWTSDNTDAEERIKIQYGTSIVYPPSTMTAHVSAVPNGCTRRLTSLKYRNDVAMFGNFGYELDLNECSIEEKEQMKKDVEFIKEIRQLVQFGDFYRLINPFEKRGQRASWMVVSNDKKEALVAYYTLNPQPNSETKRIKLKGLNENSIYTNVETGLCYTGAELMNIGIILDKNEFESESIIWHFKTK